MSVRHFLLLLFAVDLSAAVVAPARAGGTVELNLVGDAQGSALSFKNGRSPRQGRHSQRADSLGHGRRQAGHRHRRDAARPVYIVTGIITSRNEIVLPGAIRPRQRRPACRMAEGLAEKGPAAGRKPKSPYGLSGDDFAKIRKDLATPVGFATLGMTRQQVVEKIAGQLKLPLKLDADVARPWPTTSSKTS